MLSKSILEIIKQLREDIPDWYIIHPGNQKAIAEWIEQDRTVLHEQAM